MLFDLRVTPAQIKRMAEWVNDDPDMADVELCADDRMLVAEQGDERAAWDTGGEPGSDEYLAAAPMPPAAVVYLAFTIRLALEQLREHVEDKHTLELVCDRWDELEQEIGTDRMRF